MAVSRTEAMSLADCYYRTPSSLRHTTTLSYHSVPVPLGLYAVSRKN